MTDSLEFSLLKFLFICIAAGGCFRVGMFLVELVVMSVQAAFSAYRFRKEGG